MKQSDLYGEAARKSEIPSFNRIKTFESQISNGRKIFRLLLWLNEVEAIYQVIINEKMMISMKVLKVLSAVCSFMYYFTDNIVWFSKIGFMDKFVPFSERLTGRKIKWGYFKDMYSLLKTVLELIIYVYSYQLKMQEEESFMAKLGMFHDDLITADSKCFVYLRKLVILRREMRYIRIEIFIYTMRLIMLTKHLKLKFHHYLDPIFVSLCGFMMAVTTVFKAIKSKKNFYKLEIDDLKPKA